MEAHVEEISRDDLLELQGKILEALRAVLTAPELEEVSRSIEIRHGTSLCAEGGVLSLHIEEDMDAREFSDFATLRFEDIEVAESRRGQGIGRAAIQAAIDFSQEKGYGFGLSANPGIDPGLPEWQPAMDRLIAYYESFGLHDDGAGNMSIAPGRTTPAPG